MLTGVDIPDLAEAHNRLSYLALTLNQLTSDFSASALSVSGACGYEISYRYSPQGIGGDGHGSGDRGKL